MREALREGGGDGLVTTGVAKDGIEAMQRLRAGLDREAGDGDTPGLPDLVLLDLNLPRKDGREVLREVKSDPALRHIPVVVLTTSDAERDVTACYGLHANAYVIKPSDFNEFVIALRSVREFWGGTAVACRRPSKHIADADRNPT